MKRYTDPTTFADVERPMLTIGTFDGVHLGHRRILQQLLELAQNHDGETAVLTFYPHPRMVLHPEDHGLRLLSSPDEKARLFEEAGIDHLIVHPFTEAFSRMTATEYIRELLVGAIGVHTVVVGYDHHFGRNREGDFGDLKEFSEVYNFNVLEIPAWQIDEVNVSSTKIRRALDEGKVDTANSYLGYTYSMEGTVVKGQGLGSQLGIPTANLKPGFRWKLIPGNGVYIARVEAGGKPWPAVVNIGNRPTIGEGLEQSIEAHLIGFEGNLYGEQAVIRFEQRLREERKFSDTEALREQILQDREQALQFFA